MKLEDQVCSLELAKRLKELGVKQKSLFVWSAVATNDGKYRLCGTGPGVADEEYVAFTVAELGEMLPKYVEQVRKKATSRTGFWLNISFDEASGKWRYSYANHRANECIEMLFDESEADARAKLLAYLIEQKLITP